MPFPTVYQQSGALVVLMSGEMNALANNTLAPALVDYNNASGYLMGEFEYRCISGISCTANTGISMWLLRSVTSGIYEDGTSGLTPTRIPDVVFPLQSGTISVYRRAQLPPQTFRPLVKNDGTGSTMPSSGNVIRMLPLTFAQASG